METQTESRLEGNVRTYFSFCTLQERELRSWKLHTNFF